MASADKKLSTYVFLHLNTTGLPDDGECQITEICMLAINRNSFEEADDETDVPPLPRVTNKLVLCLKPDAEIQEAATAVSQLTDESLSQQSVFSLHTISAMQSFLKHLEKPVCFIAHNGNTFDFAVIKAELERIGQASGQAEKLDNMFCADSLHAIRELDPPPVYSGVTASFELASTSKRKCGDSMKTSLKRAKTVPSITTTKVSGHTPELKKRHSSPLVPARQNKCYGLREYYKDKFGIPARNSHTAEGFCKALVTVAQTTPNFFEWVDKNKQKMKN